MSGRWCHTARCVPSRHCCVITSLLCPADITVSPCYGLPPVVDPVTSEPYQCSDGALCPADTYCHRSADSALCCPLAPATVAPLDTTGAPGAPGASGGNDTVDSSGVSGKTACADSTHGCCKDGVTSAAGPEGAGCPASCECHRLGSLGPQCDPVTKRCACRPGVGGRRCDRCKPGFWGLPRIARGNRGCQREWRLPIGLAGNDGALMVMMLVNVMAMLILTMVWIMTVRVRRLCSC